MNPRLYDKSIQNTNESLINSTNQYQANLYACETCFNFLQSIYNKKQMKKIIKISIENDTNIQCMSSYHKKLVDSFKT